jgi:peptide/nickel transport system substrate-binding protein
MSNARFLKCFSLLFSAFIGAIVTGQMALAQGKHGIAMYGDPALPPDFVSLPYANEKAPKGGKIIFGESGGFDSLHPFIIKGKAPYGMGLLTFETLMGRSYDEPFTLYGLLAESIATDPARTWVEFTLRSEARFSDGSPVTPEDVIWSYETLGTLGNPRYAGSWAKVEKAEITGPLSVKFTFNVPDRELALIMGLRPILQKTYWQGKDFTASSLEAPIGSGPYVVGSFEAGRYISFVKNPNWWGRKLPFYKGMHNFDEIRYDYFGDGGVVFEAFKAGEITSYRENNAAKWAANYDFPAVQSGDIVKSNIPHQRPTGINGFVFNTRRALFSDWRVREALIGAFNFELINTTVTGGAQRRISSYFANSPLGMKQGPATGKTLALLEPFADSLLPGTTEGYTLPISDGSEANRASIRVSKALLFQAGWSVENGVLKNAKGKDFNFEILLTQGADEHLTVANIYVEALKRLGIIARITQIDSAQYKERTTAYDFDMAPYARGLSLSPGNEQMLYWGHEGIEKPGTRNWMGMNSPAAEAIILAMLNAPSNEDFITATRALDRILIAGRYVIPFWYSNFSHIAHSKSLHFPEKLPIYGDWLGFQPEVWWSE